MSTTTLTISLNNWTGNHADVEFTSHADGRVTFELYGYQWTLEAPVSEEWGLLGTMKSCALTCPEWRLPLVTLSSLSRGADQWDSGEHLEVTEHPGVAAVRYIANYV
jgi:hypothetical protein